MYEKTGEGETTKPSGRAIVPFIARRRPVMEWHGMVNERAIPNPQSHAGKNRVIRPFILARSGTDVFDALRKNWPWEKIEFYPMMVTWKRCAERPQTSLAAVQFCDRADCHFPPPLPTRLPPTVAWSGKVQHSRVVMQALWCKALLEKLNGKICCRDMYDR